MIHASRLLNVWLHIYVCIHRSGGIALPPQMLHVNSSVEGHGGGGSSSAFSPLVYSAPSSAHKEDHHRQHSFHQPQHHEPLQPYSHHEVRKESLPANEEGSLTIIFIYVSVTNLRIDDSINSLPAWPTSPSHRHHHNVSA